MALSENELKTRQSYDEKADEWMEHSGGIDRPCYWELEMNLFINVLGTNKKVLEVGAGPATDGKYLTKRGEKVISIDFSKGMLDLAKRANPNGVLSQMDMQEMGFVDNSFDGFWASASILHLEHPEDAIKELVRVTKSGGWGFISIKEGEGEVIDKNGYYFKYHKQPEFGNLLEKIGLEPVNFVKREGYGGHDWLTYLVKVVK